MSHTPPSSGSINVVTKEVVRNFNSMTNSGSAPLSFERPVPKSHRVTKSKTCFEILDEYTKYHLNLKRSKSKNVLQNHQIIKTILHFLGFPELHELDRKGAEIIADALRYMPKNAQKDSALRGLHGYELINKNESLPHPKAYIALSTVKGHLEKMSTFMSWAKYHGYVSENVFYKLPMQKNSKEKKCFPFTAQHLSAIFSMRDYTKHKYLHPYYYWIPLLLRYTGARLNELCQLMSSDIVIADGIYCMIISETFDDQSVKTGKTRLVPLHNELLNKGFIEFVNSQKNGRLFPELKLVNGYFSHNASKWFYRRRITIGIGTGEGFNAHSFRRSFINELKQSLVSKELVESIAGHEHSEKLTKLSNELVNSVIGHEHNSESFDIYSYQYSPKILAPIVNMIDASYTADVRPYVAATNLPK